MQEIRLSYSEAFWYAMIPVAIGFGLGLIPLVIGIVRKKQKLGLIGLIATTLGGAVLGVILSIPSMAIFTWLILRDKFVPTEYAQDEAPVEENEAN